MGTENEEQLTTQGRFIAAGGAAMVAATIVNPLDVVKTRMQAQAASGMSGRSPYTSSLYEQMARRCYHQYPEVVATSNTYQPEAVLRRLSLAYGGCYAPNDASWHDRKWGICEAPLCIRKSPPGLQQACLGLGTTPAGDSMWEMCKSIARREGIHVLWRGTAASLLIAVPMVGIYMPLYDYLQQQAQPHLGAVAPIAAGTAARTFACFCVAPFELLRTRIQAVQGSKASLRDTLASLVPKHTHHQHQHSGHPSSSSAAAAAVGAGARLAGPAKQLVSVANSVPHLWTGFPATLVRDVPFSALYWAMVEPLRRAMLPKQSHGLFYRQEHHQQQQQGHGQWWVEQQQRQGVEPNSSSSSSSVVGALDPLVADGQGQILNTSRSGSSSRSSSGAAGQSHDQAAVAIHSPGQEQQQQQPKFHHTQEEILLSNMVSGFIAGGLAAGATTPFDVVKTRHQIAARALGSKSPSVWATLKQVHAEQGMEGLFSGVKPRAYRAAPACGIVISVYELLKAWLTPE